MVRVTLRWVVNMQFLAFNGRGHATLFDAKPEHGGEGTAMTPMEALLAALGACSGMDVVSFLRKKGQKVVDFTVTVEGERSPAHPRYYTSVKVTYSFYGNDLDRDAVEEAVRLSMERFCSVAENLRGKTEITYSVEVHEVS